MSGKPTNKAAQFDSPAVTTPPVGGVRQILPGLYFDEIRCRLYFDMGDEAHLVKNTGLNIGKVAEYKSIEDMPEGYRENLRDFFELVFREFQQVLVPPSYERDLETGLIIYEFKGTECAKPGYIVYMPGCVNNLVDPVKAPDDSFPTAYVKHLGHFMTKDEARAFVKGFSLAEQEYNQE